MPEPSRNFNGILFAALCTLALAALIYFARSAATRAAPDYSTWSTQPDGAKLIFDGLQAAGLVKVSRQFKPVNVEKPNDSTVFFLGVEAGTLEDEDAKYFDVIEACAKRGNNVVIAIPQTDFTYKVDLSDNKPPPLQKRWGVRFITDKSMFTEHPILDSSWKELPGTDAWQKPFGKGFVTLVAKGQRLNNKGVGTVAANRQLLYELVSQHPSAVFEEAHLGIQESGSIVGLARHYRLQGLILGLILLAGMFVWSHSVRFPPAPVIAEKRVAGSDTRSMLAELMTRYLNDELLATCIAEWRRSQPHGQDIALPTASDEVTAYAIIQSSLEKRSQFTI